MARQYAKVKVGMWIHDDRFRSLTPGAQHLYFVLLTSPTLTLAGVGDWRPNRIATLAGGWTEGDVRRDAQELIDGEFIVIDEGTEEFLIRSFVKNDGVLTNPKVSAGMVKDWGAVYSLRLRACIADQVRRHAEGVSDSVAATIESVITYRGDWVSDRVSDRVSDCLSDGASEGTLDRVSDSLRDSPAYSNQQPADVIQQPRRTSSRIVTTPPRKPDVVADDFDGWWAIYPKHTDKESAKDAYFSATRNVSPAELAAATRRFLDQLESTRYAPKPVTFLRDERWRDVPHVAAEPDDEDPAENYLSVPPEYPQGEPRA